MFRIGEFSRLARVSTRLLRYYDQLGLLRPEVVSDNGYRYYAIAQLMQLNRILVLRDLGFSLEQIARTLDEGVSTSELRGMLRARQAELERTLAESAQRLRLVESRIAALEPEQDGLEDDVVFRSEPTRRFLSLRVTLSSFGEALALAYELLAEVPKQLPRSLLGELIGVGHATEFEPDDLDVELGFALHGEPSLLPVLSGGRALALRDLPGHERVAACVRVGPPERAHQVTGRIGRALAASGQRLAGPSREIFLTRPRPSELEQLAVEMVFPVEKT